jgi:hypothetical protein
MGKASLIYSFDSSKCCEINYKEDKWVRVTPNEFRSFGGKRRILNTNNKTNPIYEEYQGPVYYFETNYLVLSDRLENIVMFIDNIDPRDNFRKKGIWRT